MLVGGEVEAKRRRMPLRLEPARRGRAAVRVRRFPVRDLRHGRPAGGRLAGQGRRGDAALAGRGVPHHPARGAARARRWWTIPERRPARVRGGCRSGCRPCRPRPRRWRPSWPARPRSGTRPTSRPPGGAPAARREEGAHPPPAPSPLWRLDSWSRPRPTGWCSRRCGRSLGEPGSRYNPLVIVGAGGGREDPPAACARQRAGGAGQGPVACLSAPEFTGELIEAIDRDAVAAWRARYRRATAFLLDDVHLIAAKDRTQDELFVLFNSLIDAGRQMVFTSAAPLDELTGVEPRLRTRLEGGLVVELSGAGPARCGSGCCCASSRPSSARPTPSWRATSASRPADSIRAAHGAPAAGAQGGRSARGVPPTAALAREVLEGPRPGRRGAQASGGPHRAASSRRARRRPAAGKRWSGSGLRWASA